LRSDSLGAKQPPAKQTLTRKASQDRETQNDVERAGKQAAGEGTPRLAVPGAEEILNLSEQKVLAIKVVEKLAKAAVVTKAQAAQKPRFVETDSPEVTMQRSVTIAREKEVRRSLRLSQEGSPMRQSASLPRHLQLELHKSAIAWSLEGQIGTSPTPSASASTRASANAAQSDREHDQLSMSAAASGGEASAAEKEETHRPHTSLRRPRTSQRRRGRCCRTCPCTLSRGLSCAACCHHASSCIRYVLPGRRPLPPPPAFHRTHPRCYLPLIRAAAFQIPFTAARHPPTLSW